MKQLIELTNDFHRTSVRIRSRADGTISVATARIVRAWLCGMSDCTCGGMLGQRGRQPQAVEIEPLHTGEYRIETI
jgi:hypothetical protein